MRDRELELIAALVEGRLEDETEAHALVASAPEFRDEYQAQRLAYETLRGLEAVELTEHERAALHRDVWTTLQRKKAPAGRTPWYYRWIPATAAMLFVLVGLATVLGQLGGQDSGGGADLATSGTTSVADGLDRDDGGADGIEGDGAETFEEPADTTVAEAAEAPPADTVAFYSEEADKLRAGELGARTQSFDDETDADTCLEHAGLDSYVAVATLTPPPDLAQSETPLVMAVPEGSELSDATVAFVDPTACQLIYVDG